MLGLTQQQMAELIGVTYQQAHKYEKGINRIAGGRLYQIAQALGVEVSYFYDGVGGRSDNFKPTPQQRLLLELARNFTALPSRRHQEAICGLVRALVDPAVAAEVPELELVDVDPGPTRPSRRTPSTPFAGFKPRRWRRLWSASGCGAYPLAKTVCLR